MKRDYSNVGFVGVGVALVLLIVTLAADTPIVAIRLVAIALAFGITGLMFLLAGVYDHITARTKREDSGAAASQSDCTTI